MKPVSLLNASMIAAFYLIFVFVCINAALREACSLLKNKPKQHLTIF